MFDTYDEIFNARGAQYHQAMKKNMLARKSEFIQLIKHLTLKPDDIILDIPSGGGYLKSILGFTNKTYAVDSSTMFAKQSNNNIICSDLSNITLSDNEVDCVFSLAGTHHLNSKVNFFKEIRRVLKKEGNFVVADVLASSKEDVFLNTFVNKYNSYGHRGEFFNDQTIKQIELAGFQIVRSEYVPLKWDFNSTEDMISFVKNLFYLDLASDVEVVNHLEKNLGFSVSPHKVSLNWGLQYIYAKVI